MEEATMHALMVGQGNSEDSGSLDLTALLGYIEKLELSLAKKDAHIDRLEAEVAAIKGRSELPVFRESAEGAAITPRAPLGENFVSDESGEVEPESEASLSQSLSHISKSHSSSDEDSPADGRWNIPFDSSFDDDLVAKKVLPDDGKPAGHEHALKDIGFVPIKGGRLESGTLIAPLRPVARRSGVFSPAQVRRSPVKDGREKENASPYSTISVLREIR